MTLTGAFGDLERALDALAAEEVTGLPAAVAGEQVVALSHLLDQVEAQRLRRLAVFDRAGGAAADGAGSTAAWLRERSGLAGGAARERVAVARELADARPRTAVALAAGRISYPAAKEIALGLRDAPACVPPGAADAVEPVLVEQAPALAPGDIRRLLTQTLQALAPDALLAREQQVRDRRGVRLSPLGDGWALSGDLTGECGAALDVALRALAAGQPPTPSGEPRPTLAQRRHDALHTLARGLLDSGLLPEEHPVPTEPRPGRRPTGDEHPGLHIRPGGPAGGPDDRQSPLRAAGADTTDPQPSSGATTGPGATGPDTSAVSTRGAASGTRGGDDAPPGPLRLPDSGGERPHLLVITDLAALRDPAVATGPPGPTGGPRLALTGPPAPDLPPPGLLVPAPHLHGSGPISAHQTRRLACDAAVTRVLVDSTPVGAPPGAGPRPTGGLDVAAVKALLPPALGGPVSQVVDVGRRSRTVPPATRRAVLARDRGCRWPRCARPLHDCEVHHLTHWADGGRTDLENLLLLCWPHHHLLHEGGWTLSLRADGTVELLRPDGTPAHDLAA